MFDNIEFETMAKPDPGELLAFYQRQQHETTQSPGKLQRMMDSTLCFVTARRNGELIGIARGVTDGLWGRLSALGILMIFISTTLVIIASRIGAKLTAVGK